MPDRPSRVGPRFDAALAELSFETQLAFLLHEIRVPARYFPIRLARDISARLRQLPTMVRKGLLWRLRGARRGSWKQLKRKIARVECRRRGRDFAWPWDTGC